MSFIELNGINEVVEPTIAPDGSYELMISIVDPYTKDDGRSVIKTSIEFVDFPDYARFNNWLALPDRKLDIENHEGGHDAGQKKFNNMLLNVKRFLALWSIQADNGFDPMDLMGARCHANITSETDDQGRTFQRLLIPRIEA